jgi:DNA polymerase-3 subunit delta'
MGFAEVIGQRRVVHLLGQMLTRGRLPHAFLFTGMAGIGKRFTAFTLAKALNCENRTFGDCCDHCLSCRKAASGNHPDIYTVESDGPFIKIEQIRAIQQRLRFRPLEARCRVIVIGNAQDMKVEAANALLKVLEEPPADNLLILTAFDTTALLPTVVSRCVHLPFQPLATPDIANYLCQSHSVDPDRARMIAGLASGSLSRSIALLDEEQLGRRRRLLETVVKVHRSKTSDLLAAGKMWKGESADLRQDLEWLKTWIRDLLVQQFEAVGSDRLLNPDFAEESAILSPNLQPDHLLEMFELLCTVQGAISYNINKRLCLEALLLILRDLAANGGAGASAILPAVEQGLLPASGRGWL